MSNRLVVYYWNPNGTNDVSVLTNGIVVDTFPEALFGYRVDDELQGVTLKDALQHVAVSPCTDGSEFIEFLSKYFKTVKVR